MLLLPQGSNLGYCKTTSYGIAVYMVWILIMIVPWHPFATSFQILTLTILLLASALFCKIVQDMEVHLDMTARQKAVFQCLRAPHDQDFLLAIPIDELGQHMSPMEYRTILKYRLMIPIFPTDVICPVCRKTCLDSFGEHTVHCKELTGFKYRHDTVRDVLFDIFKRAGGFC